MTWAGGLNPPGEWTPGAVPGRGTVCQLQPKPPGSLSRGAGRAIMASPLTVGYSTPPAPLLATPNWAPLTVDDDPSDGGAPSVQTSRVDAAGSEFW